jgi:hypothetical protein
LLGEAELKNLSQLISQMKQLSPESRVSLGQYIEFLQWQEARRQAQSAKSWSFSFIEAYKEAFVSTTEDPAGLDVKMAPALVGGESRPALWAHPPVTGQAIIEFHVPVPQQVSDIQLTLAIGIRDGSQIAKNNLVAFGVKVNGLRVWGQQTNEQRWIKAGIPLDLVAGDIVRVEFTTEALGRHEWTWAVWGGPELTGKFG